jgi:hypothetical protein
VYLCTTLPFDSLDRRFRVLPPPKNTNLVLSRASDRHPEEPRLRVGPPERDTPVYVPRAINIGGFAGYRALGNCDNSDARFHFNARF